MSNGQETSSNANVETGFLGRVVEAWLTNTTEREYQFPFVQALMATGHEVLYVSSHGVLERGKDVITRSPDSRCHCYQLKTGNIDLRGWQSIYSEITELIEQPIDLPNVPSGSPVHAFLVTNGTINPVVMDRIDRLNRQNRTRSGDVSHLGTLDIRQLVPLFLSVQHAYLPQSLPDFHRYTSLLLVDGTSLFNPRDFADFVLGSLLADDPSAKEAERRRRLHSSLVVISNVLDSYRRAQNHFALIHAYVMTAALIARFALGHSLPAPTWQPTIDLLVREIAREASLLLGEAEQSRYWLEGEVLGDGGDLRRARITMVLGALAGVDMLLDARGEGHMSGGRLQCLIEDHIDELFIWGESAIPYLVMVVLWLENVGHARASDLLERTLRTLVEHNAADATQPLACSYIGPDEVFLREYNLSLYPSDPHEFRGSSMTLPSLISLCVRRGMRRLLEELWPTMVDIVGTEFRPDNPLDNLVAFAEEGVNVSVPIRERESWRELREAAAAPSQLHREMRDIAWLFYVLWLVLPHRLRWATLALLDIAIPADIERTSVEPPGA